MIKSTFKELQQHTTNGKIICKACARLCLIPEGSHGFCFVRKNINGNIYLTSYGVVSALQIDPIEKKPFNHFMPGTKVLGIGMTSCNFGCLFCLNHNISKQHEVSGTNISPSETIKLAKFHKVDGIAFTYNEPIINIEFLRDVAEEAHRHGLFNTMVTNGYLTNESINLLEGKIDAVVVDFKGNGSKIFSNKYEAIPSSDPIKESLIHLKRIGVHLEITDLIIPKVGDSLEECNKLTNWIYKNLGSEVPIHFTRFYPEYKMLNFPQTPYYKLVQHYKIAKEKGLKYVYIGNVYGNKYESTFCPKCKHIVIERKGFQLINFNTTKNFSCKFCGFKLYIKYKYNHKRVLSTT